MNRRELIKNISLTFGIAASGTAVSALMSGCKVEPKLNFTPEFLSEDEAKMLTSVVDNILPKTKTPSASEAGVVEFMDGMLQNVAGAEEKEQYRAGIKAFTEAVQAEYGKGYNDLTEGQKTDFLTRIDRAAYTSESADAVSAIWREIKGNTYFGYYSSEPIAKEVLVYLPVPGPYEGCVDLAEVTGGKSWAL